MRALRDSLSALALIACACSSLPGPRTTALEPGDSGKCEQAATEGNPLLTEWDASNKANLEARLREGGAVVVAFTGCSLRLMPECRTYGQYTWRRTTISSDQIEIRDSDELYAKLPLGALTLEGELERSGRLTVKTTVAGQLQLQGLQLGHIAQESACVGATHVVQGVSIGAFELYSGDVASARGGGGVPLVGGGTRSQTSETVQRSTGNSRDCRAATDAAPHPNCNSPLQLFLQRLPDSIVDRGPPGTIKVDFASAAGDRSWQVLEGEKELCTTPCEKWVKPHSAFLMRSESGMLQQDEMVEVPNLASYSSAGPLVVRAYPRSTPGFAGGVVATTFGGLGVATGITLLAVGYGADVKGMPTAGFIVLPIGAMVLGGGIWLLVDSGSRAEINGSTARTVGLGGTF